MTQIYTDNVIPRMADAGFMEALEAYVASSVGGYQVMNKSTSDVAIWAETQPNSPKLDQIVDFVKDWHTSGKFTTIVINGENLDSGINRPAAPTSLGTGSGNVWFGLPSPPTGTWRFYVNGAYKLSLVDYNLTTLAELGAVPTDAVQICKVEDGIVGWWARIVVP